MHRFGGALAGWLVGWLVGCGEEAFRAVAVAVAVAHVRQPVEISGASLSQMTMSNGKTS